MLQSKEWLPDLGVVLVLLLMPLILFWPVTVGTRTLLPADNLYQWEPYRSFAGEQGVSLPPHNELLSDLVLENLAWKQFIVQSIRAREIPLWNPYLFAGVPFLAAGQHSALYPLSVLFYIMPLTRAYGLFTVLQLWMAGVFMYIFGRVLRMGRFPALIAGMTYQLSAFFLVSVVFTMIIAAAAWLPLLLALIEIMFRKQEEKGLNPLVSITYLVLGAAAVGMHVLAGHAEMLVYTLVVIAFYTIFRLIILWRHQGSWRPVVRLGMWTGLMVGLGLGLGSVQLIPLLELVTRGHREGLATYADVVGWAYSTRQAITFLVPDFYGNPAHHGYWDLVTRQWVAVDRIFWGIKNYVEAGSYVGILPLIMALVAVLGTRKPSTDRRYIWIFATLALVSLLLVFGTPVYAILYYGLPGIKQLHSPFRWVFPYTVSISILAGFGIQALGRRKAGDATIPSRKARIVNLIAWGTLGAGTLLLVGLLVVLVAPGLAIPLADRLLDSVEMAQEAFSSGQMLLSYQWRNLFILGLMLAASGMVLRASRRPKLLPLPRWLLARFPNARIPVWQLLAVAVLAVDLLLIGKGFNPAADPAWLDFTPPAIEFLQERAADSEPWRLTAYQVPGATKTMNVNIPWLQGIEDTRGYDSIIPRQYVEYIQNIEKQGELLFHHIASIYDVEHLSSPLLDLLTVRYVTTEGKIPNPDYELVYEGAVYIYENTDVLPRAFALPSAEVISRAELPSRLRTFDPRKVVLLDSATVPDPYSTSTDTLWSLQPATVITYTPNVVVVDVEMPGPGWLVLADSYFPGWQAFRSDPEAQIPTPKSEPGEETQLPIALANGNFRAVPLEKGTYQVRFQYAPTSFVLGLFGSSMAIAVLSLLGLCLLAGRRRGSALLICKKGPQNR